MTPAELRQILDRLGITTTEAARRLVRTRQVIWRWLNGKSRIPRVAINEIRSWKSGTGTV